MPRLTLLIPLLIFSQIVLGQTTVSKKTIQSEEKNHQCIRKGNSSFTTRLKIYPFNKSTQIQLVSFKGGVDTSAWQDMIIRDSLPRLNDTVAYAALTEVAALSFGEVNKLTYILFNYGYAGSIKIGTINQCYYPRNAILFLDKQGKVFEYIEICFECSRTKESSDKISLGEMCSEKMNMLKGIFKSAGITYGITKEMYTDH